MHTSTSECVGILFCQKNRTEILLTYWRNSGVQAGVPVSQSLDVWLGDKWNIMKWNIMKTLH